MRPQQSGNILFIIMIAIFLIGTLTAVMTSTDDSDSARIDDEILAIRASEVQRYASEIERAVRFVIQNGYSESDIRFAHTNAPSGYGSLGSDNRNQVFAKEGGGAMPRPAPDQINNGAAWEYYGGTAVPGAGSDRADLVAVLPNVTKQFCEKINSMNGQPATIPIDDGMAAASPSGPGDCIFMNNADTRFGNSVQFYNIPNTMDETTFAQDPNTSTARTAMQACVMCARDSKYHFYHVILAR